MTLSEMQAELNASRAAGIAQLIYAAAEARSISQAWATAIGSRENDLVNSIGDDGHAVGVMQIDIRSWPQAVAAKADGSWQTSPDVLIGLGCQILAENLAWAQKTYPDYNEDQWYKIASAAYNAGQGGAARGVASGDVDSVTTGGNYGADVLTRKALLEQLGL